MEARNIWTTYNEKQMQELNELNERYKSCLDQGKTERECVALTVDMAEQAGYQNIEKILAQGKKLSAGDKVYAVCMSKMAALFCIGEKPISEGMNILGAHIDSPRIDVKQNPLYENEGLAYLDTHYYGGIKKYQWVAQPLALHGVIVKKDGTVVKVNVGEEEADPVFVITDLLVHLAQEQLEKKASKVIEGEKLDLLIGNRPIEQTENLDQAEKDAVKKNVMRILKEKYGMEEEDFYSAELEIVPAGKARDCGFDRSMILSYGQDDRVCAFTSLFAMLDVKQPVRTGCCLLVDKEEIGSVGATGMHSKFFENTVAELVALTEGESELKVRRALSRSKMLSSDVSAAYDPMFAEAFEKRSSAFFANGLTFNKFTGSRGKSGSNDANAEYLGRLRQVMDEAKVAYQFAELGKVDLGGGGTIAYIMANYGMEVIDSGVAVLNMHAPYEVTSKADVYEAVKGYRAFLQMK
ncbi:aminopeptidase [Faecalicatena acetigenes]|uniref:M18 family aminopeptidase n=1 Tax=Faecalicatena acetigenes TaxID=2981790 RepID=A0ABT2TDT9_9FIRM|nr:MULTISPECIES: aminopeptidase [Lachnospiraceae]MCU6748454.1 aminopeptidase [Faecalicatena acetigenes]SCI45056.1 Probable M18 family aminopeptidase 1 [uncultured Clostridium sp.]